MEGNIEAYRSEIKSDGRLKREEGDMKSSWRLLKCLEFEVRDNHS